MRPTILASLLAVLCLASAARAQEVMTCTGDDPLAAPAPIDCAEPPAAPAPPQIAPVAPRWADVGLAVLVVGVGIVGLLRLRRRRAEGPRELAPYVAGGALGVLMALSLLVFAHPVGVSGAFIRLVRGDGMAWPVWIVLGIVAGSFVAARMTGGFRVGAVPASWAERHGPSLPKRFAVTFVAAALMETAAGIAGGCTSGLALSGGIGLGLGAFVFMAAMFATGMPAAWLAHGRRRP